MKTILVTGGLGYIGSHTVVELINSGYEPIIVDNLSNTSIDVLNRIEQISHKKCVFYPIDVCNKEALSRVFDQHSIDGVIHFAAFKAVGESVEQPLKYYQNNIGGLITLLEVMQEKGVKNIVFSSSCTVYGEPDSSPVNELSPIKKANSPYGNTKQIGEEILSECGFLNCVALRYFNPIGAHSTALIGELPLGVPNNLMPYITQTAIGIREQLTIFGNDYQTTDGTCIRDYIHVVDLADAHVKALEYIEKHKNNTFDVFNIGTGEGYSVLDIVNTFQKENNIVLKYAIGKKRAGDVEQVWADNTKAKTMLHWQAKHTLADMVKSSWKWQLSLK
ncbi:MAG: UDP-glucose 4-epimerase GalE [Bacteroidota bacterium]|nr:UDP-glucose 4-epimerase GalE [Bacteroidota bacterium]